MSDRLLETRRWIADYRERQRVETIPSLLEPETWTQPKSATASWHTAMLAEIRHTAEHRSSFTVGDLRIPATPDKRAVGAVLLEAARRGWIDPGGWVSGGNTRHGRPIRQWFSNVRAA
jgi:hypothetical protein